MTNPVEDFTAFQKLVRESGREPSPTCVMTGILKCDKCGCNAFIPIGDDRYICYDCEHELEVK